MTSVLANERLRQIGRIFGPAACILAVQLVFFRVSAGYVFYGVVLGLLGALVAVGMALVYRANRILNFAQSDLGLVPTVLAGNLILLSGVSYVVAAVLGLGAAVVLGIIIEFFIIRRFFRASRLILTVATIGLAQLLVVASLLLPRLIWQRDDLGSIRLHVPLEFGFDVAGQRFSSDYLVALVVAPLALIAVALFLRYTNLGIAVRASAERADRAGLLGIPVKRLNTVVWVIATVLSFIGLFLRAGVIGLPVISTPSYTALLTALAALMLGRLTNLPAIAVSAVALGVLEQAVIVSQGGSELFTPILAVIILVALLVQKVGQSRSAHDTASSWQSASEVRPVPRQLHRIPEVLLSRWGLGALGLALVIALPFVLSVGNQGRAAAVVIFAMIGVSIVILTGWAGQVSLGQMSFVAVGSVAGAIATKNWGFDLLFGVLVAAAIGAVVAVIVGLPALRLQGLFLSVTTLAFAVATSAWLLNRKYATWIPQRVDRPLLLNRFDLSSDRTYYFVCLVFLGVSLLALTGIRRSRTGRVLLALRENERGVTAYGVSVSRAKMTAFAMSGALAAAAGALFVHLQNGYYEEAYAPAESFSVFTSTVVGGLGSFTGGIIGAVFFNGSKWFLGGTDIPLLPLLPSAVGVLFVLMALPEGLGGVLYRLRDSFLRSVARRRHLVVPSLLADVRVEDAVENEVLEHAEESVEAHGSDAGSGHDGSGPGAGRGQSEGAEPQPASSGSASPGGGS